MLEVEVVHVWQESWWNWWSWRWWTSRLLDVQAGTDNTGGGGGGGAGSPTGEWRFRYSNNKIQISIGKNYE